ncbi:MAG: peptide deformylase [Clostridia bacterium]|nr:peptide deformylase [Clostridia bacterium]
MALLNILKEGEETLRKVSRPVEKLSPRLIQLLDDMQETLKDSGGVGLAAPQVGILRRVVLVDNGEQVLELINPEIIETKGVQEECEGCLSVPGKWGITKRPAYVKVRAMNRKGKYYEAEGTDLVARCFCHEIDHLNGILFTDNALRMLTEEEIENM